jgi:actin-related protein 5
MSSPYLSFENVGSKYKDRKLNQTINLVGGQVYVDASSRSSTKVPFELDVVSNFDVMENVLDFVMLKLGIDTETVRTPILMTESLCNPSYSRSLMTELLFESYSTPSVCFGLDSLFSFYDQNSNVSGGVIDGLVISSASSSTQVIPVLSGKSILTASKKLSWGGQQSSEYLLKLMQLKYPSFPGRLSSFQSGIIYREHCYNSIPDYTSQIKLLQKDVRNIVSLDRIIQFPFNNNTPNNNGEGGGVEEKNEEELVKQSEKRKEASKRLQEQAAKQRQEKLERQQEEFKVFGQLKQSISSNTQSSGEIETKLEEFGFSSIKDLDDYLNKLEKSLTRARNKELGIDENEQKEQPSFPLIDVPDHTLNEEDLKEKRKQKLMKAGYDARIRIKREKEQERLRLLQLEQADTKLRESDFQTWLENLRTQHQDIMTKIKERKKKKEQLGDRKSLAAQQRMKSIAGLAADESKGVGSGGGGSVGGPGANKRRKKGNEDDGFGKSDADWLVYREIVSFYFILHPFSDLELM